MKAKRIVIGVVLTAFLFLASEVSYANHRPVSVYLPGMGNIPIGLSILERPDFQELKENTQYSKFVSDVSPNSDILRYHSIDTQVSESRLAKIERDNMRSSLVTGRTIRNIKGPVSVFNEKSKKQEAIVALLPSKI